MILALFQYYEQKKTHSVLNKVDLYFVETFCFLNSPYTTFNINERRKSLHVLINYIWILTKITNESEYLKTLRKLKIKLEMN